MGLAVYNSIILDLHFPSICYRKLLSPPVVPPLDSAAVGVTRDPTIDDLAEIMPVRARIVDYHALLENTTYMHYFIFAVIIFPWVI